MYKGAVLSSFSIEFLNLTFFVTIIAALSVMYVSPVSQLHVSDLNRIECYYDYMLVNIILN